MESDIESVYEDTHGDSCADKQRLLIDTKNLCLLCFNSVPETGNTKNDIFGDPKKTTFQFQFLSRLLGLNLHDIIKVSNDDSNSKREHFIQTGGLLSKINYELQLTFCPGCSKVITLFFDLYQEIEMAKMLVNDYIRQIRDSVVKSDKDESLLGEYRRRRNTSKEGEENEGGQNKVKAKSSMSQAMIVADIRESLVEKCSEYLTKSTPRVMLQRVSTDNLSRKVVKIGTGNEDDNQITKLTGQFKKHYKRPKKYSFSFITNQRLGNGKSLKYCTLCKKAVGNKAYHGRRHLQETYQCPHCPKKCPNQSGLRRHTIDLHCEQTILNWRLPNVTPKLFKVACRLLYKKERDGCSTTPTFRHNIKKNGVLRKRKVMAYKCRHCDDEKIASEFPSIWPHIIEKHCESLKEKLNWLQRDTEKLMKNINLADRRKPATNTLSIPHGLDVGLKAEVKDTRFKFITRKVIGRYKNLRGKWQNKYEFYCTVCKVNVGARAYHGRKHMQGKTNNASNTVKIGDGANNVNDFLDEDEMEISVNELEKLKPLKIFNAKKVTSPYKFNTRKLIDRYKHMQDKDKSLRCSYCPGERTFKQSSSFRYHNYSCHLEKYFVKFKESQQTEEQFKVAVSALMRNLDKKFTKTKTSRYETGMSYKCSFCTGERKSYSSEYLMRMHMIEKHTENLGTMLKDLGNNPDLLIKERKKLSEARFRGRKGGRGRPKKIRPENNDHQRSFGGCSREGGLEEEEIENGNADSAAEAILLKVELFDNPMKQEPPGESELQMSKF